VSDRAAVQVLPTEIDLPAPAASGRRTQGLSLWQRFARNRLAVVGLIVLVALALIVTLGPLVIPSDRVTAQVRNATFAPPSVNAWFGRDEFGRDAFVRAVYGGRISLGVSVAAAIMTTIIGVFLGMVSGYAGGIADALVDRFTELVLTLPFLMLLILAAAIAPPSPTSIVLILGLFGWPVMARLVRGEFVMLKHRDFIEAARACGASDARIVFVHILPNAIAPIVVTATLILATNLIAEATISFLGLGIHPPTPSWGNMLTEAQRYLIRSPFLAVFPGMLILITVLCVNLLGDGLRDALDPHQRR
jgi:peptide/nickel transport system permease protein